MNGPDKAVALDQEIRGSDALRIYNRLVYLSDVIHLYQRNYYEFQKLLTAFNTPEAILTFMGDDKRDDLHLLINELNRYFLNYVTSAQTLKDHCRIMIKATYKNQEFMDEYQAKIDQTFTNNPLSVFVQDLRDYTLHYALPATISQIQFLRDPQTKQSSASSRALLDKKSLLYGYKWQSASKKYLAESPEEIDLLDLINKHHNKFVLFYDWLLNRLKSIHAIELEWLEKKTEELQKMFAPIYN
jgi:hypothetical protein